MKLTIELTDTEYIAVQKALRIAIRHFEGSNNGRPTVNSLEVQHLRTLLASATNTNAQAAHDRGPK